MSDTTDQDQRSDDAQDASNEVAVADTESSQKSSRNPFKAIWTYLTQVVSEMKKVIWPTYKELLISFVVVLAFLIVATALVFGVDAGFGKLVTLVL